MAQRVSVLLVDDLDGGPADQTVDFALDGVQYEIDLSDPNAEGLREALDAFVSAARRTGGRRRDARNRSLVASTRTEHHPRDVREWARGNGYEISDRGRVSAQIRAAYAAAH